MLTSRASDPIRTQEGDAMTAFFQACSILIAALGVGAPRNGDEEKPFRPTAVFDGTHSQIKKEKIVRVLTADAWKELWQEHRGKNATFTETGQSLEIDFETHYVIAIFVGNCDGCAITPRLRGDTVLIGYKGWVSQTEGRDERTPAQRAKDDAMASYAFVILPRSRRTVLVEENVQRMLGEPPIWKQRVSFPAPDEKK